MTDWDKMSESERKALFEPQSPASQVLASEEEEEDDLPKGKPYNPQIWPQKRPMSSMDMEEEEDDEIIDTHRTNQKNFQKSIMYREEYNAMEYIEEPDLSMYLGSFGLTDFQQISLCRTYANYLAQRAKAKRSKTSKD